MTLFMLCILASLVVPVLASTTLDPLMDLAEQEPEKAGAELWKELQKELDAVEEQIRGKEPFRFHEAVYKDQVSRTADGKPFCDSLNNTEKKGFQKFDKCNHVCNLMLKCQISLGEFHAREILGSGMVLL